MKHIGIVALITGAARKRGMGHATAICLAKCGADVVVNGRYRPSEEFPEEEKTTGWKKDCFFVTAFFLVN